MTKKNPEVSEKTRKRPSTRWPKYIDSDTSNIMIWEGEEPKTIEMVLMPCLLI